MADDPTPAPAKPKGLLVSPFNRAHVDGWANVLTGLGRSNRDKRLGATFQREFELDRNTLENLYHGDDIIARIIDLPAKEALREWIEILADDDRKIAKKLDSLNAKKKLFEAIAWARLYGGSIAVMVVNDGETLDTPLDVSKVKDIVDLMVIDRWDLWITRYYNNPVLPNFGQAELYSIRTSAIIVPGQGMTDASYGATIHESRVLRFEGVLTGRRRRRDNQGWALSVLDRVIEVCRDFTASYASAALLVQDFSQAVFKIKGLANALSSDQDNLILKRMQLLDLARSVARAVPLDADSEDFERKSTPVSGLDALLDRMASRLSAATGIPITLLMGTSAAGMNATGDGDLENWYNEVHNFQEMELRHPLSRLIQVCAQVVGVKQPKTKNDAAAVLTGMTSPFNRASAGMGAKNIPDLDANSPLTTSVVNLAVNGAIAEPDSSDQDVEFNYRPLWQPTEKEIAETRLTVAQGDQIYYNIGVLDSAEIGVSRFGGEKYSMETTLDMPAHTQSSAKDTSTEDDPKNADPDADPNKPDPELVKASGNAAAGSDIQATALNGAQVTALQAMLASVQDKTLDPKAAIIAIQLSFPAFDPKKVSDMVNAIEIKEPEPAPTMIPGVHPATGLPMPVPAPKPGANPIAPPKPAQSAEGAPSGDPVAVPGAVKK